MLYPNLTIPHLRLLLLNNNTLLNFEVAPAPGTPFMSLRWRCNCIGELLRFFRARVDSVAGKASAGHASTSLALFEAVPVERR